VVISFSLEKYVFLRGWMVEIFTIQCMKLSKQLVLDLLPYCSADAETQLPAQAIQCGIFGG